jgi:hypothetical protein
MASDRDEPTVEPRKETVRTPLGELPPDVLDGASVIHGVTICDILRAHKLIRRFGWDHLLRASGS